ncbi:hypothetical protein PAF17_15845 [Paracoccus sp. Z330]|uniref:Uncharacterized protein n=1 Tax=Paracoccus onchidii TaxID=3017813 RepID=A0ABT4ZHY4_9RHOB|nr:hypothetical protein [Paracoccus onchidii]MDB6178964.1 hypothetical protein [Paracoccus onchidii]
MRRSKHRGISIRQYDMLSSPFYWSDDENSIGGIAADEAEVKDQIDSAIFLLGAYHGWTLTRLHNGEFEARGRTVISGTLATVLDRIEDMAQTEPLI